MDSQSLPVADSAKIALSMAKSTDEWVLLEEQAWSELKAKCRMSGVQDMPLVEHAYAFASKIHAAVARKSGEPYIMHPLAIAQITLDLLPGDSVAVAAALLHDVVEDGVDVTPELLNREFNPKVSLLVEGLTKISKLEAGNNSQQLLNYDKLLKSMERDLRIVFIKLADRLHNMQTLGSLKPEKQEKIANETMYFYVPLAEWLGLYSIKSELENLGFKYRNPQMYEQVQLSLDRQMDTLSRRLAKFSERICKELDRVQLHYKLESRIKSNYSIWRKMQKRNVPFEEVFDLLAVRVVFTPVEEVPEGIQCWYIYTLLTECYMVDHSRTRNWVSSPKVNGYEALHCTLIVEDGGLIEVQIRTDRMHELAEYGEASHRKYKGEAESEAQHIFDRFRRQMGLSQETKEESKSPKHFVETAQETVFSPQILVYSHDGAQAYNVMRGSTVLDFAYHLGEETGHRALGALVNGGLTKLDQVLQPGSRVEILTAKSQRPSVKWLDMVKSSRVRALVERDLQQQNRERIQNGKLGVRGIFENLGMPFSEDMLRQVLHYFSLKDLPSLYEGLAQGMVNPQILRSRLRLCAIRGRWNRLCCCGLRVLRWCFHPAKRLVASHGEFLAMCVAKLGPEEQDNANAKPGHDVDGRKKPLTIVQAPCCWALPGDEVVGEPSEDRSRIIAHRKDCHASMQLLGQHVEQAETIQWEADRDVNYITHIYLNGEDREKLLADIFGAISSRLEGNSIYSVKMESRDHLFEGVISISVHEASEAEELVKLIRSVKGTQRVYRITTPSSFEGLL